MWRDRPCGCYPSHATSTTGREHQRNDYEEQDDRCGTAKRESVSENHPDDKRTQPNHEQDLQERERETKKDVNRAREGRAIER